MAVADRLPAEPAAPTHEWITGIKALPLTASPLASSSPARSTAPKRPATCAAPKQPQPPHWSSQRPRSATLHPQPRAVVLRC